MSHTQNPIPATVEDLERQIETADKQRRKLLFGVVMRSGDECAQLVKLLIDRAAPETLRAVEAHFEVGA